MDKQFKLINYLLITIIILSFLNFFAGIMLLGSANHLYKKLNQMDNKISLSQTNCTIKPDSAETTLDSKR